MTNKVSFWLIPSEEDRGFFQEVIDTLAREYDAPTFTPHVTIYSGNYNSDEAPDLILNKAVQRVGSFSIKVDQLLYTNEFTKTLFIQLYPSSILSQISEAIRNNSQEPADFTLNPHLSLIYKQMGEELKRKLITELSLPKSEVFFDEVLAIAVSEKVQSREDVESWKVICTQKLQQF